MGGRTAVRRLDEEPENAPTGGRRAQSESECRGWWPAATLVSRFRSRRDRRRQRAALPNLVSIAKPYIIRQPRGTGSQTEMHQCCCIGRERLHCAEREETMQERSAERSVDHQIQQRDRSTTSEQPGQHIRRKQTLLGVVERKFCGGS